MKSLRVDTGWRGSHGIARYSSEILPRLTMPWRELTIPGRPGSVRNLLSPRTTGPNELIYSPGYNAGPTLSPQFVTVHDLIHLHESSLKYSAYYRSVLRPAIKRAGVVFTVSETSRESISEWLDDNDVAIVVTGNGCSDEFSPSREERSPDVPYFVYVGNLKRHKNFEVLLPALAIVPDVRLVAVTPEPEVVARLAMRYGVSDRVSTSSGLSDSALARLFRSATATLVPSRREGFGLPALESLCTGTPVVYASVCSSVAEIVGTNGIAVGDIDSATAWGEGMAEALSSAISVDADAVRQRHRWDDVAARVTSALNARMRALS